MKILVTGGTGSFGSAFVEKYHKEHTITVFSRDELKQHEMRRKFPGVTFALGDVRDRERVFEVVPGFDYIFHAAALKQVPSCEFFPLEAIKTNVLGTNNVLDAARGSKVVCLSTDKAVYPINAMGVSKAMMEKLAISKGAIITRYGNVMQSRGSVIPLWQQAAMDGDPLALTNPDMTRFLLSLDDSIDLVWFAMQQGSPGDIFVKKAPACTMLDLAKAIGGNTKLIGIRHGEKMHETLISAEEMYRTDDMGDYYRIQADTRDLNYDKYYSTGTADKGTIAYTSENTRRLNITEVKELIGGLKKA